MDCNNRQSLIVASNNGPTVQKNINFEDLGRVDWPDDVKRDSCEFSAKGDNFLTL